MAYNANNVTTITQVMEGKEHAVKCVKLVDKYVCAGIPVLNTKYTSTHDHFRIFVMYVCTN